MSALRQKRPFDGIRDLGKKAKVAAKLNAASTEPLPSRLANYLWTGSWSLEQRCQSDLELVSRVAVKRDIALLFGEHIGKSRREAVIVEAPVEQAEIQLHGSIACGSRRTPPAHHHSG